ncbi:MAG TPA: LacI family DNA-binding transcriptional regulator [Steroidobacteraceae bacterium]|jgi:LacI family transcriptional regulator
MSKPARRTRGRLRAGATIKDVARHAGVSPMTVSRVVNDSEYVSNTTRNAVQRAVRELGYSPNLAARNLASERGERMGLLYGNPSSAYLSEFLVGALEAATRHGVQLVLEKCEPTPVASRRAVRRLLSGAVVGVVLPPPLCESSIVRAELNAARLPIVTVAAGLPPADTMCVRIDDYTAALEMTRFLLSLGHERLAFIKGHPNQSASDERWRGFRAALEEAGRGPRGERPPPRMEQGFFSFRSGLDAARKLLAADPAPTAIFASNDDMAAAVIAEAHRRGLDVPRDLTVVGFDDTLIASTIWPELTTIQQPIARMAAEAIDMLVAAVRGSVAELTKAPGALADGDSRSGGKGAGTKPGNRRAPTQEAQAGGPAAREGLERLHRLIPHALISRESAAAPKLAART